MIRPIRYGPASSSSRTRRAGAVTPLTVVDLFSGAGGLSLGFQRAGWRVLESHDHFEAAAATYRRNLGDRITCGNIHVFAQIIVKHKPCAFVFENVEGFLTAEDGGRVLELLAPLVQAGYRIHLRKVNAANYGVPQHRKRVVAIGGLGWEPTFPEPTHRAYGAPGTEFPTSLRLQRSWTRCEACHGQPRTSPACRRGTGTRHSRTTISRGSAVWSQGRRCGTCRSRYGTRATSVARFDE